MYPPFSIFILFFSVNFITAESSIKSLKKRAVKNYSIVFVECAKFKQYGNMFLNHF